VSGTRLRKACLESLMFYVISALIATLCRLSQVSGVPGLSLQRSIVVNTDEGPASDSDDELWHERIGRLVVASPFLTRVFPNIARRTAVAHPYLATPPTIPETAVVEEEEDYRTATPLSAPGLQSDLAVGV
jgi:hypothetical protein